MSDEPANGTILVVDDEEAVSRLLVVFLRHVGFRVLEARSGEQALRIIRDRHPPIDLMLADLRMPGMSGLELAALALCECPGPQMILMGCQAEDSVRRTRIHGHIVPVLPKPLNLDALLQRLQIVLPPLPPVEECGAEVSPPHAA